MTPLCCLLSTIPGSEYSSYCCHLFYPPVLNALQYMHQGVKEKKNASFFSMKARLLILQDIWLVLIWCIIYRSLPRILACSPCCSSLPGPHWQYSSVYMPQGTCVWVRPGRRQKMTPDLYLSAFKSRVLWLNTTTEQFACCKALRLNCWFPAPCQVILPWQCWLQCYQRFIIWEKKKFC